MIRERMRPVLFFDIDDTLYRRAVPFCRAAEDFFGDRGQRSPQFWEQAFEATQKRCEEVYFPVLRGEMTSEEGFIYRFQKGFEDVGIRLDAGQAQAFKDAYQEAQKHITLDSVAEQVLTECRTAGAAIGLISNGQGPHQRAKIRQLGLSEWVEEKLIVISGEIGIDKPDLGIFAYAARQAGARPDQLVYVGDSMENDILPAEKAGWSAVLWDPKDPESARDRIREILNKSIKMNQS